MKAIILAYTNGAVVDKVEAHPRVLLAGASVPAMLAVETAITATLAATNTVGGAGGDATDFPLRALQVEVEDEVEVGDTLDVESLVFKKHV